MCHIWCFRRFEGRAVDGRTDQYALALILFEMIVGRRPFDARNPVDMLSAQVHQEPPSMADLDPLVPPAVVAAVAKGLSKHPNDRFANCQCYPQQSFAYHPTQTQSLGDGCS